MLDFRLKTTTFSYPSNVVNRPSPKLALPAKPKFGMDDQQGQDYYDQESAYQTEVPAPYIPPPVVSHRSHATTVTTVPWSGPQQGYGPPPQDDWVPPPSQNYNYYSPTPASVGGSVMSEDRGYGASTPMGHPEEPYYDDTPADTTVQDYQQGWPKWNKKGPAPNQDHERSRAERYQKNPKKFEVTPSPIRNKEDELAQRLAKAQYARKTRQKGEKVKKVEEAIREYCGYDSQKIADIHASAAVRARMEDSDNEGGY